ncbi:MAG: protein O-mannosyl-transferase family [Planctomycetota bacterium]
MTNQPARFPLGGWLALFLACLILYSLTANRGPQWQDSGQHIIRIVTGELANTRGLALTHPLHYWLGRLALAPGILEPCLAVTLVSAFAAALAVANVFGCALSLTNKPAAALFAAGSLAVACTFWQLATLTETYTLTAALLAAECWCLTAFAKYQRRSFLWAMLFCNGLGIANHMLASLTTPVLAVVVIYALLRKRINFTDLVIAVLIWLAGTLPYSALVLAEMINSNEVVGTIQSALFGRTAGGQSYAGNVLNVGISMRLLAVSLAFVLYNFPNLLLPAALYGMARVRRLHVPTLARRALWAGLIIHACFVLRYNIVDQHTFFLPLYVFLALFAAVGAAALFQWLPSKRRQRIKTLSLVLLLATPVFYWLGPVAARHYNLLEKFARNKPYRDDYTYLLVPWSIAEKSADILSTEAMRLAGPQGTIVLEDNMARFALEYQKNIQQDRSRVEIITKDFSEPIQQAVKQKRPVVLVPLNANQPQTTTPKGNWQPHGDLYMLDVSQTDVDD